MIWRKSFYVAAMAALLPLIAWAGLTTQSVSIIGTTSSTDSTPNSFSFTDQTDVATSSTITSAAVTISGINTSITCSATGGTLDVNSSGSFSSSQSVSNSNTIRARHTSSASNSTAVNTVVDCGTGPVSDTFTSTTEAGGGGSAGFSPNSGYTVTALGSGFTDGELIRIVKSGGGFGTKPNGAKALHVFPYQTAATQNATWSRTTDGIVQNNTTWVSSGDAPILTNSSGYGSVNMSVFSNVAWPGIAFPGQKLIRVVKFYFNWDWQSAPVTNIKFSRVWAADATHDLIFGISQEGGFDPKIYVENIDDFPGGINDDVNFTPEGGKWYTAELLFSQSSANDVRDGVAGMFLNALRMNPTSSRFITRGASQPTLLTVSYGPQISANEEPSTARIYTGFDYADDSWCSSFISSESSYQEISNGSGTEYLREYNPINAWSDTTVDVYLRYGQRTSIIGEKLYIRTDAGTVLPIGEFSTP